MRHVHFYPVPAATRQSSEYINDPFLCYALIIIYRINTILASWRYNFHLASYTQKNSNNNQFIFFLFFFSTSISHFIDWNYSSSYDFYDFDNSFLFKKKKRKKKSCDEICPSFFLFFFFLPFQFSCLFYFLNSFFVSYYSRTQLSIISEVDERKILPVRLVRPKWIRWIAIEERNVYKMWTKEQARYERWFFPG